MAQVLLTIARGAQRLKDVTQGAGTAITGSDAISLNIDQTKMTKGEALELLERLHDKIFASPWPLA